MPCGQKCKEILDGAAAVMAAVEKSVECMKNSLLLGAANDAAMPAAELLEFRACGEAMARAAQAVALKIELPAD